MNAGFIKFMRSDAAEELMCYPASFTLLAQIAYRARREVPKINPFQMVVGEAMIGDYATIGLTRQQFRQALERLKEAGFITTRATNKGTIAKLCNEDIYDINTTQQQPTIQPAKEPASNQPRNHQGNQPATTNKNDKNDNNEKNKERKDVAPAIPPSSASLSEEEKQPASVVRFPPDQAEVFSIKGFAEFVAKMKYGNINKGFYLTEIQRKAELMNQERDETGWQNFVAEYFKREMKSGLIPADVTDTGNARQMAPTSTVLTGISYDRAALARKQSIPTP